MQGYEYSQPAERIMRIRRVDPVSLAKVEGAIGLLLGLIAGLFAMLWAMLFGAALAQVNGGQGGGVFVAMVGVGAIIFYPAVFGIGGFIHGLIVALIYNLVAKFAGGLEFTVE